MQNFTKKLNKGFTLLETIIALLIFSLAILVMMSVLASGVSATSYVKQKITASYLAQEGIEYMRNIRDTYVLYDNPSSPTGWSDFQSKVSDCFNAEGCYFDDKDLNYGEENQPITSIVVKGCTESCQPLYYNPTTGKYGHGEGADSGFVRKINITSISADEVRVSSTVTWEQASGDYSTTFSEDLFNWTE